MNVFNNFGKVEEFVPISVLADGKYLISFNKVNLTEEEVILKNSRYVSTGRMIPTGNATWQSIVFNSKPTVGLIEKTIFEIIDNKTVNLITNAFKWKGNSVYLSKENQMNYKNAFDLAVSTEGENLPVVFKFAKNGKPVYYSFDTINELKEFYIAMSKHISNCLEAGWKEKDKFDRNDYKI